MHWVIQSGLSKQVLAGVGQVGAVVAFLAVAKDEYVPVQAPRFPQRFIIFMLTVHKDHGPERAILMVADVDGRRRIPSRVSHQRIGEIVQPAFLPLAGPITTRTSHGGLNGSD